mmetsp:Transcript_12824/g.39455  ORF Transcript_12824/g.39455 Transcript_12824/m.39455 type:complete len:255 (-) Transcript_12824:251-1015(-)
MAAGRCSLSTGMKRTVALVTVTCALWTVALARTNYRPRCEQNFGSEEYYLERSDAQLWEILTKGDQTIGSCELDDNEKAATGTARSNLIASMRNAISNGHCDLDNTEPKLPLSSYLELSDEELFRRTTNGHTVGNCFVYLDNNPRTYCDMGVLINGYNFHSRYPQTLDGRGTGCIKAPDFPKRMRACWYTDPDYGYDDETIASMCTESGVSNAAGTIRAAIREGKCCSSANPNLLFTFASRPRNHALLNDLFSA